MVLSVPGTHFKLSVRPQLTTPLSHLSLSLSLHLQVREFLVDGWLERLHATWAAQQQQEQQQEQQQDGSVSGAATAAIQGEAAHGEL